MPDQTSVQVDLDVPVSMRDGTVLYANVYRPASGGPVPVILARTPYNKALTSSSSGHLDPFRAVKAGYAVVIQDCRGRYASHGEFDAFQNESRDGYDTVEWCAAQPWSTDKVGMYGLSYWGLTQWQAALARPPHLAAIVPTVTASDYHEGWAWQGGAFELGFNLSWTLGVLTNDTLQRRKQEIPNFDQVWTEHVTAIDSVLCQLKEVPLNNFAPLKVAEVAPYYFDWLAHPDYDEFWQRLDVSAHHDRIDVPALNIGGWYDIFLGGTIQNYEGLRQRGATAAARSGTRLLLGPWVHGALTNPSGNQDFGFGSSAAAIDRDGLDLRFYDRWLKGMRNGIDEEPSVQIFVMGENVWRDEKEWPLARTQYTPYYLHSNGRAPSLRGDGVLNPDLPADEPPDHYVYNPRDPAPTAGGGLCCYSAALPPGPFDQREIEARSDVLVYTTPALQHDVEVTGPITVRLFAASSAPNTDFTGKLVDVEPCGFARNLTDGIIRADYREGRSVPRSPIEPDRVYEYTIDLWATSNLFKAGHQIRLEISSSNFPRFDANPNTGGSTATSAEMRPALQTILHDGNHPSHVVLPIIPR